MILKIVKTGTSTSTVILIYVSAIVDGELVSVAETVRPAPDLVKYPGKPSLTRVVMFASNAGALNSIFPVNASFFFSPVPGSTSAKSSTWTIAYHCNIKKYPSEFYDAKKHT